MNSFFWSVLVLLVLCKSTVMAAVVTRDDVVTAAQGYADVQVTLSSANLLSPTSYNGRTCDYRSSVRDAACGGSFFGEAYKWCGFENTSTYQSQVSPGNKKVVATSALGNNCNGFIRDLSGTPYSASDFTGVDCSGLVSRAWGISTKRDTSGIRALTLPIPWSQMKRGDVFVRDRDIGDNTHAALLKQDISGSVGNIIHATKQGYMRGQAEWRVINEPSVPLSCPDDYNCFLGFGTRILVTGTPFPQFSNFSPSDGAVIGSSRPTVSADIRSATNINTASIVLKIDGNTIAGPSINGSGTQVSVSSTLVNALSDGSHTISVTAANSLDLIDTGTSTFSVDVTAADQGKEDSGNVYGGGGGVLWGDVVKSTDCVVIHSTDTASGICSMQIAGPSGFSTQTATFDGESVGVFGPFCQLSSGTYTITTTNCAQVIRNETFSIATAPYTISIDGGGPGWQESQSQISSLSELQTLDLKLRIQIDGTTCSYYQSSSLGNCHQDCPSCQIYFEQTLHPAVSASFGVANVSSFTLTQSITLSATFVPAGTSVSVFFSGDTHSLPQGTGVGAGVRVGGIGQAISRPSSDSKVSFTSRLGQVAVTAAANTVSALAQALRQVLKSSSGLYAIGASEVALASSTGTVNFTYTDVNADTTTLKLYQYADSIWSSSTITSQEVSKSSLGVVSASGTVTGARGWYAAFYAGQDSSAPVTTLSFQGTTFYFNNDLFVSTDAFIVLSTTDPVVNGFNTGLATTYYRVDPASAASSYSVYSSSIALPLGPHLFQYYSRDWKGNDETVKTSTFVVTAGAVLRASADFHILSRGLIGFLDSNAQFEVESRAENDYTILVSSADGTAMMSVDNIGAVSLGDAGDSAVLTLSRTDQNGDLGLQLRSGNSTGSVSSSQIAFGAEGEAAMRHTLWTQHNPATAGNRLGFNVWHTGASTTTLASLNVMTLEAITSAGSVHVRPSGTPDVELEVSDGASTGGGTIHRASASTHSSRRLKSHIRSLSAAERRRAVADVLNLNAVEFRYKKRDANGGLAEDSGLPVRRGYIFEESPMSIRGPHEAVMIDDRLVNLEIALQEAVAEVERLEGRLERLKAGGR